MLDTEGINVYRKEVISQTRANYKKVAQLCRGCRDEAEVQLIESVRVR